MVKRFLRIFLWLLTTHWMTATSLAYEVPERLHYKLSWMGIPVGSSTLETRLDGSGLEIVSTVESALWTAPFYKVADIEVSTLTKVDSGFEQKNYRKDLSEGELRVRRQIALDYSRKLISHCNLLTGLSYQFELSGTVWDPVAAMHVVRNRPLGVGERFTLVMLDNDRPDAVEVRVLRREFLDWQGERTAVIVVQSEADLNAEGLFYATGPLTVWLSDDARRIPLRIEKRIIGLFEQGVPSFLHPLIPDGVLKNSPRLETVRADLEQP